MRLAWGLGVKTGSQSEIGFIWIFMVGLGIDGRWISN